MRSSDRQHRSGVTWSRCADTRLPNRFGVDAGGASRMPPIRKGSPQAPACAGRAATGHAHRRGDRAATLPPMTGCPESSPTGCVPTADPHPQAMIGRRDEPGPERFFPPPRLLRCDGMDGPRCASRTAGRLGAHMRPSRINDDAGRLRGMPGLIEFEVDQLLGGQDVLLRVVGEIDVATAPLLRTAARDALAERPGQVHLPWSGRVPGLRGPGCVDRAAQLGPFSRGRSSRAGRYGGWSNWRA